MRAMSSHPRPGMTLIELLVALPLLALLGVVSVQLALVAHRHALRIDGTLAASRELRQAGNTLVAEVALVRAADLYSVLDTLIDFDARVGAGIVCAVDPARLRISLASGDPNRAASVSWLQSPQAGDVAELWSPDSLAREPRSTSRRLARVTADASCANSPLNGGASATVVIELSTPAPPLAVGTPVRITRRTRYSLYKATDGDSYLGRRTLGPSGWDVIQPVAGPLLDARQRGLRVVPLDVDQQVVAPAAIALRTSTIAVELRAPARVGRSTLPQTAIDSTTISVTLRGDSARAM